MASFVVPAAVAAVEEGVSVLSVVVAAGVDVRVELLRFERFFSWRLEERFGMWYLVVMRVCLSCGVSGVYSGGE